MKHQKRIHPVCLLLCLMLIIGLAPVRVWAEETDEQIYEICTPEDLFKIGEDPSGTYYLMNDLDMTGLDWHPLDFSGRLEGGGHAILNLSVSGVSDTSAVTYDGNRKQYDTFFSGMFGCLTNAEICDLKLLNVRALVETDVPCFLGSIAGYSDHSLIINCQVSGQLELRAHDRMFGVGGIVGYGNGMIEYCKSDMVLICTDTDAATKDEQFLGGAYAAGYVDLIGNEITVDGYDSDHGYVHNGGTVGMYIQYPLQTNVIGYLNGNTVTGKITFFEDNYDRRAYCEAYVGETMNWRYQLLDNTESFLRDERFDYSRELRPEMCEDPVYSEQIQESDCQSYGYTEYRCESCGYTYRDQYTILTHRVSQWQTVKDPTVEETGLQTGKCDVCGLEQQREIECLEPTEPKQPQTEPKTEPKTEPSLPAKQAPVEAERITIEPLVSIAAVILLAAIVLLLAFRRRKRR